jgi:hypothetical protein
MRRYLRLVTGVMLLLAGWLAPAPPRVQAANLDTTADRVFG